MRKESDKRMALNDDNVQFVYEVDRCDRLNIRYGPGYAYDVIRSVPKGTKLISATPMKTVDDWTPVYMKYDPSVVGYCNGSYLKRLTEV